MKLLPGSLSAFALVLGALHALPTMAEDRNQDSKSMTTIVHEQYSIHLWAVQTCQRYFAARAGIFNFNHSLDPKPVTSGPCALPLRWVKKSNQLQLKSSIALLYCMPPPASSFGISGNCVSSPDLCSAWGGFPCLECGLSAQTACENEDHLCCLFYWERTGLLPYVGSEKIVTGKGVKIWLQGGDSFMGQGGVGKGFFKKWQKI